MPGVAWTVKPNGEIGLTATGERQLGRIRRSELSASTSFALDPSSCAVSMVGSRLLPRDDDAFEPNQLGTAAHAVLEHIFNQPGAERTKELATATSRRLLAEREFALLYLDEYLTNRIAAFTSDEATRWLAEVDRRTHGLWEIEDPTTVTVHFTEMAFGERANRTVMIGRVPFVGYVDRVRKILDVETGEVISYLVDDYKAGKVKQADRYGDDYGDQIRIYDEAVFQATGIKPDGGSLLFIAYGVERKIDTSPEAVAVTIKRFERAYDRMNKLTEENFFPAKGGPLCGWCELVNACPVAKKDGRTDLSNTEKVNGKRVVVEGKKLKGLSAVALGIPTVGAPAPGLPPIPPVADLPPLPRSTTTANTTTLAPEKPAVPKAAAHIPVTPKESKEIMTTVATTFPVKEGTSCREASVDGSLNGASYAATAVFGITSLAVEQLSLYNQPINGQTVAALTQTYATIVQTVQAKFSGSTGWGEGINTRIRGALRTSIETIPAPWGGDVDAWTKWVQSATNRTSAITTVAIATWNLGTDIPESPWAAIAASS